MGSTFVRFLVAVTAVALTGAAAGGVMLTLQASVAPSSVVEFAVGRVSGTVVLEAADDTGRGPFTEPVAVDLGLDPLLLPLPPLNAGAIDSPHHRNSAADLLAAGVFGRKLVDLDRSGVELTVDIVGGVARETSETAGVADLVDDDHDSFDDDGRFTLRAADGSAVCVRLPVRRALAAAQGLQLDGAVPVSGYWWSSYGPCGAPESLQTGSDVRVGTTPGMYGASRSGEVCDVGLLAQALAANPVAREAWETVLGIDAGSFAEHLDGLTPVVLLRDTTVTDHGLDRARIVARSAILQRGTAVLVDETGSLQVRCVSGSPLRTAAPIPSGVAVEGTPWSGFSLERVQTIPAAARATSQFVLVDLDTGFALHRASGATGTLARLAGPLYPPASG